LLSTGAVLGTAVIGEPRRAGEIFGRQPDDVDVVFNWAWPLTAIEPFAPPHSSPM
jgi:hypothetical protein